MPDSDNIEIMCLMLEKAANAPAEFQDEWFFLADCALRNGFVEA